MKKRIIIVVVIVVLIVFTLALIWVDTIRSSYSLIKGDSFRGCAGNNTVCVDPLINNTFNVTGDNPGVRSPLLAWPIGIPMKNYDRVVILATVIVRDASGQEIDGGIANGDIHIKDETGRWWISGWNNRFEFNEPVKKNGIPQKYTAYFANARSDLIMVRYSVRLTNGPAPGTTETWIFHEVRFE